MSDMSDLERSKALLLAIGQEYSLYNGEELNRHDTHYEAYYDSVGSPNPVETVIKLSVHKHKGVHGYSRFFTCFYFDKDGKYLGTGIWE
jgi:hypothetical protein